jgi:sugar/nucleoside kinase (ribokinase family)
MSDTTRPRVVTLGVHIVDVLGRPVSSIPAGQGRKTLDEIRLTVGGSAAGTGIDLAKLGASVVAMGAIGDDRLADFLISVLTDHGVDAQHLARKAGVQTAASILPIRPNGERPSLHVPGASAHMSAADVDRSAVAGADLLHVGGPDALGDFAGEPLTRTLQLAKANGVITTMDLQTPCDSTTLTRLVPLLPFTDYLLPNQEQLRNLTGKASTKAGAEAIRQLGVGCVATTLGPRGSLVVAQDTEKHVPAFDVPVVDTTGCGDAYSAGFIIGLLIDRDTELAAWLGTGVASLVIQGLGSDAGISDRHSLVQFLVDRAPARIVTRLDAALHRPQAGQSTSVTSR